MQAMSRGASSAELRIWTRELAEKRAEIEESLARDRASQRAHRARRRCFKRIEELGRPILRAAQRRRLDAAQHGEVKSLSVMRGSLTPEEFDEIRSHVSHTYASCRNPWGKTFARVAVIGWRAPRAPERHRYPNRLRAEKSPWHRR